MPWFKFAQAFDWKPRPSVTMAYKAGDVKLVTTACAQAAEKAGKGERTRKPHGAK